MQNLLKSVTSFYTDYTGLISYRLKLTGKERFTTLRKDSVRYSGLPTAERLHARVSARISYPTHRANRTFSDNEFTSGRRIAQSGGTVLISLIGTADGSGIGTAGVSRRKQIWFLKQSALVDSF